jgi:ankyrin repeat protein
MLPPCPETFTRYKMRLSDRKTLVDLPNELLFTIASFLSPKDVILLKTTSKNVNRNVPLDQRLMVLRFRYLLNKSSSLSNFERLLREPLFVPCAFQRIQPHFDPVHDAATYLNLPLVKLLEKHKFKPHYYDALLVAASYAEDAEYVRVLLQGDAFPWKNKIKALKTSFLRACSLGNVSLLSMFLKEDAVDVECNSNEGLRLACEYGRLRAVQELVAAGANVHALHDSPLCVAATGGHLAVVRWLLELENEQGERVEFPHIDHALHRAVAGGHVPVVELLLNAGADIHSEEDYALRLAASPSKCSQASEDMLNLLIRRGANVHVHDDFALRWAAGKGHLPLVRVLLANGGNARAHNNHALFWASGNGHTPVVLLLIQHGAEVTACNSYALRWAVGCDQHEVADILRSYGASDDDQHQPLKDPLRSLTSKLSAVTI